MIDVIFGVDFVAGQHRPRVTTRSGFPRFYDTQESKANKQLIAIAYRIACRKECLSQEEQIAPKGEPVEVLIRTHRQLPKRKRLDEEDTLKPDADNIAKLVMDALTGVAYEDDSQVTKLQVIKHPRTSKETLMTIEVIRREDDPTNKARAKAMHREAIADSEARKHSAAIKRAQGAT